MLPVSWAHELFFEYAFLQRAIFAALIIAVLSGVLGVYVVLRGLSMLGDGIAHISFAGVAIGLAFGIYPLGFALLAAILGALAIHFLQTYGLVKSDAAIGILFTAGLALGILIVSAGPGFGTSVHTFLFGNLLAVTERDLWFIGILAVVLVALLVALRKELFYVTFSPEAARISGVPVGALDVIFTIVVASTIVVAVRIVGVLLVSALLVVPAASALQVARSFRTALAASVAFAVAGVLAGVYFSVPFGTATGASIALATTLFFVLSTMVGRLVSRTR